MDEVKIPEIKIVDFREWIRTRKILEARSAKEMAIAYKSRTKEPVKFERTIKGEELPSNKLFEADEELVIKSHMFGTDMRRINDLNGIKKKDPVTGEMVQAYGEAELMFTLLAEAIISWTFTDENGVVAEITPQSVESMITEDINFLTGIYNSILSPSKPKVDGEPASTEPKIPLTEGEGEPSEPIL